jgi:hypothetical protein
MLQLGKVENWISAEINAKQLGSSIVPPYTYDITKYVKKDENILTLRVNNILANKLSQKPGGVEGGFILREYGLFGPVRIVPYRYVMFKF